SVVVKTSLSASGTPASGPSTSPAARRSSTARAAWRAPSAATCRKAWTASSTSPILARCASVTSSADTSPAAIAAASPAALIRALLEQQAEPGLVQDRHTQGERLLVLGARILAGHHEAGLSRHRGSRLAPACRHRLGGLVPGELRQRARDHHRDAGQWPRIA